MILPYGTTCSRTDPYSTKTEIVMERRPRRCRLPSGAIPTHMNIETQSEDLASLYRRAFAEHGARALWNKRELERPTPADALVVARALRVEGNREARRLAEQIERACRAALWGAAPLNRDAPRISGDIDLFHDREERVAAALAMEKRCCRSGAALQGRARNP